MIFNKEQIQKVAEAWVKFNQPLMDADESDSLADVLNEVDDLIQLGPEEGWMFIESVRQLAVDPSLLSNLAAGPLEDYLVVHGETEITRLESLAKQDPSLRSLLGQTWKNSISDAVWRRVQLAASSG